MEDLEKVFHGFAKLSKRTYRPFEYYGASDAQIVIVACGAAARTTQEWIKRHGTSAKIGVVNVRISRPWSAAHFLACIPHSTISIVASDDVFADAASSFHHEAAEVREHDPPLFTKAGALLDSLSGPESIARLFGHEPNKGPMQKFSSSLIKEVVCYSTSGGSSWSRTPILAEILGQHLQLSVQEYDSIHEKNGTLRKQVRFGPIDVSSAQYPVYRADVLCLDSASLCDSDALLNHIGRGTIVVVNSGGTDLNRLLSQSALDAIASADAVLYAMDVDGLMRKVLKESRELTLTAREAISPLALLACALHFCNDVASYAQVYVHLCHKIHHVVCHNHGQDVNNEAVARSLCKELSEHAFETGVWMHRVPIRSPHAAETNGYYLNENHHEHVSVVPVRHDAHHHQIVDPVHREEHEYLPLLSTPAPAHEHKAHHENGSSAASVSSNDKVSSGREEESVYHRLLHQLFRDRLVVNEPSHSLEMALGHFLGMHHSRNHNGEKIAKHPSKWIVCSSGSSIDLQSVHHVLSSRDPVHVLILCSGAADDAITATRDAGLYAMNYGGAYVASICADSSNSQAVKALTEADAYTAGPSIILALQTSATSKHRVEIGSWPLYRWNPDLESRGSDPFILDSAKLKSEVAEFLRRDQHLSLMARRHPVVSQTLLKSLESDLAHKGSSVQARATEKHQASFAALKFGLNGNGAVNGNGAAQHNLNLLILYGSDGGKGAGVADTLAKRAEASGCGETRCLEANDFKIADLEQESHVIFVLSTAGQGEDCANAKHFTADLMASSTKLTKLKFAMFGLGDSSYWGEGTVDSAKYFCLPARRVHNKLISLGAFPLVPEFGLGDDQDDDGYDGALSHFEPVMWKAMNVKVNATVGAAAHVLDDDIKIASNYLRGTIAEALRDTSTGKVVYEDTKLLKFHGIYQQDDRELRESADSRGVERAYSFMIRIGVPGGVATAEQYLLMDDLCDKYASGRLKLTTRQAYQFHGIVKKNLKLTMQGINRACLDTLAACGDVHRNIIANPRFHDSPVYLEVNNLANAINAHLKPRTMAYSEIWLDKKPIAGYKDFEPLYGATYLPRKFKIAIAVPPENDVDVFAHCCGFIAITQGDRLLGYNVCAGGGMGTTHGDKNTYPRLSDVLGFCLTDQAVKVAEAIMLVQRDHGERVNRKHARLKYTVEDHGWEWYRERVEEHCGFKLSEARPFKFETNADKYGWRKGERTGMWTYTMFVENGYIHDENPQYKLKSAMRELATTLKVIPGAQISLTANQNLILGGIPDSSKGNIQRLLSKWGVDNEKYSAMRLHSMACVALPTCALAMAESQRYLPSLITKLEQTLDEVGLRHSAITIRMTGCPNGCARPYLGEIGFVGKAPGVYNLHLGAGFAGNRLNRIYREGVNEEQILEILRPMLRRYALERRGESEHFGDFLIRVGIIMPVYHGHSFWAKDESENDTSSRSGTSQLYW